MVRLEAIAREGEGTRLTAFDRQALALTHGFAHGAMHSLFFTIRCDATLEAIHSFFSMASSKQVLSSNKPHDVRSHAVGCH